MTPKVEIVMENVAKFDRIIINAKKSYLTTLDDAIFIMESFTFEVILTFFSIENLKLDVSTASSWQ